MRYTILLKCIVFCILFLNTTCDDDVVEVPKTECDQFAIADNSLYQGAQSDFYQIVSAEVVEDCLNFEVSASGCSGDTWDFLLLASEDVMESFPIQRNITLILVNQEACLAIFTKEVSFDLTDLQVEGEDEITFNLEDYEDSISYTY